ncbi:MAG TPA: PEP-utilizing enzyme [Microbacterium sp.]|nr:PEP-utilizing enzyme [Microbacterium sp.]
MSTLTAVQTTKLLPSDDAISPRYPMYTRANSGEVFIEPSSPLNWSLVGLHALEGGFRDALIQMGTFSRDDFGPEELGGDQCVASFGGYIYMNLSINRVLGVRAPGFSTDAIDQSFFGANPDVPAYVAHPDDENEERTAATGAWMASLFAPAPDPNQADRASIDETLAAAPDLASLSNVELVAYARDLTRRLRGPFRQHMVNTFAANIVSGTIAGSAAAVGLGDKVAAVLAGEGDADSAKQSFALWEISRVVRNSPLLSEAFDAGLDGLVARLRAHSDAEAARFIEAFEDFIAAWGFIGPSVWELRSPTYASEPRIVLQMIDAARRSPDSASPKSRTESSQRAREEAVAAIAAALSVDPTAQGTFQAAAAVAPAIMPAREGSKVQCTRLMNAIRQTFKALGERYVAAGVLTDWVDVLMLLDSEVDDFLANPSAYIDAIRERRAALADLEASTPPFIVNGVYPSKGDFTKDAAALRPAQVGDVLQGLGVSPGTHTGRAKIIDSIDDDIEVEPDDVLIARTTDSSWGTLFLAAGAIVVETGSTISHAAIVSRELGIPAAVSVNQAQSLIPDGALVSVDGSSGTVTVLEV